MCLDTGYAVRRVTFSAVPVPAVLIRRSRILLALKIGNLSAYWQTLHLGIDNKVICAVILEYQINQTTNVVLRRQKVMFKKLSIATAGIVASLTFLSPLHAAESWRAWNIHNDGHPNTAAMDLSLIHISEPTRPY